MDSFEQFNEDELPPKKAFYSTLKNETISNENYVHTQDVFRLFGMVDLGDYHSLC